MVNPFEELLLIVWNELEIIEWLEGLNFLRCGHRFGFIVYQPASHIWVQTFRYFVEEILRLTIGIRLYQAFEAIGYQVAHT